MAILYYVVAIGALLFYFVRQHFNYWRKRGIPHDPPSIPSGHMKDWPKKRQISQIFSDTYAKYKSQGPYAGFFMFSSKAIIVTDLELIKNILIKDFNNFDDRGVYHNVRDDPLTGNLFSLSGDRWRQLRHKLSPTFTSGKIKFMFPTVLKVGEELVKVFDEKVKESQIVNIIDLVARYTADVIGSCAFGLECNSLNNADAEFVRIGRRTLTERRHGFVPDLIMFNFPNLGRLLRMKSTLDDVENFYMNTVRETIKYRVNNNIRRKDFMDMLIGLKQIHDDGNAAEGLSFEEVVAQAFIFFLAGFETSSTTMGFALYELAHHQNIQDQLRAEINTVLGNHNNEFTYDCMKEMKFLEQVIDETLRKYPVLGHLIRKANSHYVPNDARFYIEAGTGIIIPVLGIHYNEDIYPEPEKFKPERFTADEIQKRPACSYLPFGDGPRNCIGLRFGKMQTCIGLAYLIKNFRFEAAPETQHPLKYNIASFLLSAEKGIHLRVTPA